MGVGDGSVAASVVTRCVRIEVNYKAIAAVIVGLMLAACGGSVGSVPPSATASPTATPTAAPTPSPTPTPTPAPSATPTPAPPPPPPPPTATVLKIVRVGAYSYAFSPVMLSIGHGAPLTVTNTTAAPHTMTADGGAFNSGTVSPNSTITMTFSTPGTFPYHCQIHPYMTGTLTVT